MSQETNSGSSQSSQLMSATSPTPLQGKASADKSALPTSEDTNSKALPSKSPVDSTSAVPSSKADEQDRMGSKFAALSRKEREIQAQNQKIKAEREALLSERSKSTSELESQRAKLKSEAESFQQQRKEYEEFQVLKKSNPLKAMESLGFSYQQLTDIVLNEGKPTPEQLYERSQSEMKAQLDAYKKELEDRDLARARESEEKQKQALEAEQKAIENERIEVLNSFQGEINDFVKENSDEYELLSLNEANEIVYSVIERHFEETGKVMSIKEASDVTEQWLEQQVQRNLATKKLSKSAAAKVSSTPASKESKEVNSQSKQATATPPKTITNNMTSTSNSSNNSGNSEQDRIRRALAALDRIA